MENRRRLIPSTVGLTALATVARTGSFTLAAQELSLTQSAVSRQEKGLEEQLACALFDRTSRKVELTEAGQHYVAEIQQALQIIRDATIQITTKRPKQVLNIAILPTFGTRWLMPRISGFVALHPGITLNFTTRIGRFDFYNGNLDIAIYHGLPNWPNVKCTLLMNETLVPVASRDFIKANTITSPQNLLQFQRLSMHSRPNAWTNWFKSQGFSVSQEVGMSFEHFSTLSQACMAGIGVALLPEILIEPELERRELVQIGAKLLNDSAYYVAQPAQRLPNNSAELFKHWLLEEAGKNRAA